MGINLYSRVEAPRPDGETDMSDQKFEIRRIRDGMLAKSLSLREVHGLVRAGKVGREDEVRKEGRNTWHRLDSVTGLEFPEGSPPVPDATTRAAVDAVPADAIRPSEEEVAEGRPSFMQRCRRVVRRVVVTTVILGVLAGGVAVAVWFTLDEKQKRSVSETVGGALSDTVDAVAAAGGISGPPTEMVAGIGRPTGGPLWISERLRLPVLGGIKKLEYRTIRRKSSANRPDFHLILPLFHKLTPLLLYVDRLESGVSAKETYRYAAEQFGEEEWFDFRGNYYSQPKPDDRLELLRRLVSDRAVPHSYMEDATNAFTIHESMAWLPHPHLMEIEIVQQSGDLIERLKVAGQGAYTYFLQFRRDESGRVKRVVAYDYPGTEIGDLVTCEYGGSGELSAWTISEFGAYLAETRDLEDEYGSLKWSVFYTGGNVGEVSASGTCGDDTYEYTYAYAYDDASRVTGVEVTLVGSQPVSVNGSPVKTGSKSVCFIAESEVAMRLEYNYEGESRQWRSAVATGAIRQDVVRAAVTPDSKHAKKPPDLPGPFEVDLGQIRIERTVAGAAQ